MIDLDYFKYHTLTGIDEVGRGPLAGPVVACACSYSQIQKNNLEFTSFLETLISFNVTDSKKLKDDNRKKIIEMLSVELIENKKMTINISENSTLSFFIKEISVDEIDKINILNASLKAMKESFEGLKVNDGFVLIDGNKKFESSNQLVKLESIVKGDSKSLLIGLASIIAKVYRDNLMSKLSLKYPEYNWNKNAGYGTKSHLDSIRAYGVTNVHRKTFKGVKEFYEQGGMV